VLPLLLLYIKVLLLLLYIKVHLPILYVKVLLVVLVDLFLVQLNLNLVHQSLILHLVVCTVLQILFELHLLLLDLKVLDNFQHQAVVHLILD